MLFKSKHQKLRDAGIGQRRVKDIPNYDSGQWQDIDGNSVNIDDNSYAFVNPYTGVPIPATRITTDDEGNPLVTDSPDVVIRPYKGYSYKMLPYHDTLRMYKVPVKENAEVEFTGDQYFETPQLVGEDNWKDPSENIGNYLAASATVSPLTTAVLATGYLGDRIFHDFYKSYNGTDLDKNSMQIYNPGGWITGGAVNKGVASAKDLWRWGNAYKSIGSGAEVEKVLSAPFKSKVRKVYYEHDPQYMAERSRVPESLPQRFEGYTTEGKAIYSQKKVKVPQNLDPKKFTRFINSMNKNGYKFTFIEDNPVFIHFRKNKFIDDVMGNLGELWGRYKFIDPIPLSIADGLALY